MGIGSSASCALPAGAGLCYLDPGAVVKPHGLITALRDLSRVFTKGWRIPACSAILLVAGVIILLDQPRLRKVFGPGSPPFLSPPAEARPGGKFWEAGRRGIH